MSDVKAIRYLLANNASLTAVVPAAKIVAGLIQQGTVLPAIAVNHISTVRRQTVTKETKVFCTSRVQVTVMATSYAAQKAILALVRTALPRTSGVVNNVEVDNILPDNDSPDFRDDEIGAFMQSMDFIITHNE